MTNEYKCKKCGRIYLSAAEPYAVKDNPCTCGGRVLPAENKEMKLKKEEK